MMCFDASVLPAPDSPEMTMQQSALLLRIPEYAASASAKMCGSRW